MFNQVMLYTAAAADPAAECGFSDVELGTTAKSVTHVQRDNSPLLCD